MSPAQRSNLMAEVDALDAPLNVKDAARQVVTITASNGTPPRELVSYVQAWIGKRGQQDRYGK